MILTTLILLILASGYAAYKLFGKIPITEMSKWARANKVKARWMLVALNLALAVLGSCLGLFCDALNLRMPHEILYLGLGLFAIGTVFYPLRNKQDERIALRIGKRRWMTGLRLCGASISTIAFANLYLAGSPDVLTFTAAVHPAVLIVLATVGLIVVGFFILAFSCALSCNGYDAAAVLLAVVGGGGLIALYVWLVIRIMKSQRGNQSKMKDKSDDLLDEIS